MTNIEAIDGRNLPIFIHRELDDLGLDPYEFRIYARLARRAGPQSGAFESVTNMATGCRMSERKAHEALRELERRALIEREQRPGSTSVYRLTDAGTWKTPARRADPPTPAPDADPPLHHVQTPPAPDADKGTPLKEHPLKVVEDEDASEKTNDLKHTTREGQALAGLLNADARSALRMHDPDTFKLLERAASSLKWTLPQKIGAAEFALEEPARALEALTITLESRDGITGSTYRYWKAATDPANKPKPRPSSSGGRKPWDTTGGDRQNRDKPGYAPVRGQTVEARRDQAARDSETAANDSRRRLQEQVANLLGG